MIVDLASSVQKTLDRLVQTRDNKNRANQISNTRDKLIQTTKAVDEFVCHHQLVLSRVGDMLPSNFASRMVTCRNQLAASRNAFESSPYQVAELNKVESDIKRLDQDLLIAWGKYVQQEVQPKRKMFSLLAGLPEVQRSQAQIEQMLKQLETQASIVPTNEAELAAFKQRLDQVATVIATVGDLSPAIQDFLQRVQDGTFTIADLSDEVLEWCQVSDRGRAFRIRARA